MAVVLYWMAISHPSQAARKMLDLKGIDYSVIDVRPFNQRVHLRLAGFRQGTVPAVKLDERRVQGSRAISRALDERWPSPPLFPADPEARARVEAAELWGERELQPIPRRMFRFALAQSPELRRFVSRAQGLPAPSVMAAMLQPLSAYYARTREADGRRGSEESVRTDLAALPGMLDHVDRLLAEGTLTVEPPNAAAFQILSTVRVLEAFADLQPLVRAHACHAPALELFPRYPAQLPPFLTPAWLAAIPATAN
jgi:glutathione S-transferase